MSTNCTAAISADPDINGIGIRVSVYVTTVLLSLIPRIPETEELTSALSSAAGLQAMSLTVTALVKTHSNELSLYHALIIFHLLFFLGINVDYLGPISGSPFEVALHLVGAWIGILLYLAWSLHLWKSAPFLGPAQIQVCNSQIEYVVFFKNVQVIDPGLRWFFVAIASLGLFVLTLAPLLTTVIWTLVRITSRSGLNDRSKTNGAQSSEDVLSDHTAALRFLAAIYSVVMLELTVRRNKLLVDVGEAKWNFGQIAAMVILLSTVNEILHAMISLIAYEGEGSRRRAFYRAITRVIPFSSYWLARKRTETNAQIVCAESHVQS